MNCKVCHSGRTEAWFDDNNYFTCNACDCIFRSNPPDKMINSNTDSLKQNLSTIISKRFWNVVANQYLKYLKSKTGLKFQTAFDIGSAYGHFVKKLEECGIDAIGVEKEQRTYDKSVTTKIRLGYFDESMTLDSKYDLISFTQMIYYLNDPISVLNHAKKFLSDGGLIFIATYNANSPLLKKYPQIIQGVNILLSRKNFENLSGFRIMNFTNFQPDIFIERYKTSSMFNELKNYIRFHFKQAFKESEQGPQSFILLQALD